MKKIKSVSLLTLLALSGNVMANKETDEKLIEICTGLIQEDIRQIPLSTGIDSSKIINAIAAGEAQEKDIINICQFLKEHEAAINSEDTTIDKNNGMTR
jgi:hypothetical protein